MAGEFLDLRDLLERFDELTGELEDGPLDEDEADERAAIAAMFEELTSDPGRAGWDEYARNEPTLIADEYFEEYARDLARDIGSISGDEGWPLNRIDWEAAAEDLQQDYTSVTFDGGEYWIRSY